MAPECETLRIESFSRLISACAFALVAMLALLCPSHTLPALAQEELDCNLNLQQCFNLSDSNRDLCFQRVSEGIECKDAAHGRIAVKRAGITLDSARPQIIDRECLLNFDNYWMSYLVSGTPLSSDGFDLLSQALDGCQRAVAPDLLRP
jgi:hypothetical protein